MLANILRALTSFKDGFDDFILQLNDNLHFLVQTLQDNTESTIEATNDWILEWGDWLVEQIWYYVMILINGITAYFVWRYLTVIFFGAIASTTLNTFKTGVFLYFLAWGTSVLLRIAGLTFLAFNLSFYAFIPNVGEIIVRGLSLVPAVFQPTLVYLSVPEAIHFMFSVFAFIATFKIGRWVFQRPSLGG